MTQMKTMLPITINLDEGNNIPNDFCNEYIVKLISNGCFTPFLGAGASLVFTPAKEKENPVWGKVVENIEEISKFLGGDANDPRQKFIGSFIKEFGFNDSSIILPATGTSESERYPLINFQAQLTILIAEFIQLLTCQAGKLYKPITSLSDYKLPIPDDEFKNSREIMLKIFKEVNSLKKNMQSNKTDEISIFLDRLHSKLKDFFLRNFVKESHETAWKEAIPSLQAYHKNIKTRRVCPPCESETWLSTAHIEWLTHLLWHSLRREVPVYPDADELSFVLSFYASLPTSQKSDLARSAEIYSEYTDLVEVIKGWFGRCDKVEYNYNNFHKAIALSLREQFNMYNRDNHSTFLPIALTTNFDKGLERALDAMEEKIDYHLLYPVILMIGKDNYQIKWVRKDVMANGNVIPHWVSTGANENMIDSIDMPNPQPAFPDRPKGPIIIKLHGSPLDAAPPPNKSGGYEERPYLVLSESGYLEAMKETFPVWLSIKLKKSIKSFGGKSRHMLFLGYSLSDWNVRAALCDLLMYRTATDAKKETPLKKTIIIKNYDSFKTAIFPRMDLEMRIGKLEDVATAINNKIES
jgi:hypothetical protein